MANTANDYSQVEVSNFSIEFTLQHIARCDKVFHAARQYLRPEHFSKPGESVYRAVWVALLDHYERHQTLPTYNSLSARVMTAIEATPLPGMAGMTDLSLENADALMRFMYEPCDLESEAALDTLRELLLDRETGDALRQAVVQAGGRYIQNLPRLIEMQQRRVEEITAIGRAEDDDTTMPENWDVVAKPRHPTGLAFMDRIMEGGTELQTCNVILGASGGGKTTLSVQTATSLAKTQLLYEQPGRLIEPGLVVFVGYEDDRREQQIRFGACAADVLSERLRSKITAGVSLSTRGNLQPYEQMMYASYPAGKDRPGEAERLEAAKSWMNRYLYLVDYKTPTNGGRGGVPEIRSKLTAIQQKRGLPIRAVFIDWAGEMVGNYLWATYGRADGSQFSLELGRLVRQCKSEIAASFNTTVWISHQMVGRLNNAPPARKPHHNEAEWCSSFANNAWYAFCLGTKDIEHNVCQFLATKTRHGQAGPPTILRFTGFNKFEDMSEKFKPDHAGMRLLPREEVDRVVEPIAVPRRGRRGSATINEFEHEI